MTPEERRQARMARIKARAAKGKEELANTLLKRDISSYANNKLSDNQNTAVPAQNDNSQPVQVVQNSGNGAQNPGTLQNGQSGNGGEDTAPLLQFETSGPNTGDNDQEEDEREVFGGATVDKNEVNTGDDVFTRFKKMREKERKRVNLHFHQQNFFKLFNLAQNSSKSLSETIF